MTGISAGPAGAGSDLGKAVAIARAGEGAGVAALEINRGSAEETAEPIAASDGDAMGTSLDVTDADGAADAVRVVEGRWAGINGLFNNAAIAPRPGDGPIATLDRPAWDRTIAVNLTGAALMLRHRVPSMVRSAGANATRRSSPRRTPWP